MCVHHVPSPAANAKAKIEHIYTGPSGTELAEVMADCDPEVIKKLMSIDFKLRSIDLIGFNLEYFCHVDFSLFAYLSISL